MYRSNHTTPTSDATTTPISPGSEELCPQCGAAGPHWQGSGIGSYHAILVCAECGAFLRWLSIRPTEVQAAKIAITDLLDTLLEFDIRTAVTMSRRIARLCPWLRGV